MGFSISPLGTKRADLQCIDQKWQLDESIFYKCSPMNGDSECDTELGNSTVYMMNSTYGFIECNEGFSSTSGKFWMAFTCRQGEKIFDLMERELEVACLPNGPCKEKPFPELINGDVVNFSGPEGWCKEGFKFPSGDSSCLYACIGGAWELPASQRGGCLPHCLESCHNGGTCIAPGICSCPSGFSGHTCTDISLPQDLDLVSDVGNMMKGLNDKLMMPNHEKEASTTRKRSDESMLMLDDDKLFLSNNAGVPIASNKDLFGVENEMLLLNEDQHSIDNQVGMSVGNNKEILISGKKMSKLDDGNFSSPSYVGLAENSSKVLLIVEKVVTRLPVQDDAELMAPIYEEGTKIKNKDKSTNIIQWRNEGNFLMPNYKDVGESNSQDMAIENMSKLNDDKLLLPHHEDLSISKVGSTKSDFNDYQLLGPSYEVPPYGSKAQTTKNVDTTNDMAYDLSLNSNPFKYDIPTSDEDMKQDVLRLYAKEMQPSNCNEELNYFSIMEEERGDDLEPQRYQAFNRRIRQLELADLASEENITNSDTTSDAPYDSQSDITTLPEEGESTLPTEISEDYSTPGVKEADYSTPGVKEADYSTPGVKEADYSTPGVKEADYSTPGVKEADYSTPGVKEADYSTPGVKEADYSTPGVKEADYSTPGVKEADYSTPGVKEALPKKNHESDYTASNEDELLPIENPENDHPDPEEDELSTDESNGKDLEPFIESVTHISSPVASSTPSSKIKDFSDLSDTDNLNAHSSNSSDLNDVEILENYFTNDSVKLLNYTNDSNRSIGAAISSVGDTKCCEISTCGSLSVDIYNAMLRFSDTSQTASCRKGYTFVGGEASLTINCTNGEWVLPEPYQNMTEVTCEAVCDPPCNNSGKCIEPGVCRCPESHAGDRCQFLKCLSPPPHVKYAELEYKGLTSIARCLPGYILPGGNDTLNIECLDGKWVPAFCEEELDHRLECLPVCEEECLNGGHCAAPNTCACPMPYDGPMCQELRSNDCRMSPPEVKKAYMNYTVTLGEAKCIDGYALPSGETSVKFICKYGEWKISYPRDLRDPECHPVCVGGCQNGGICVDANRCHCPKLYTGQFCQEAATDVCPFTPLPVPNSITHMSPRGPYVICRAGYAFLSGETQLELWCHENNWVPAMYNDPAGVSRPIEDANFHLACLPTCYPPCQNHGKCVDVNVCHCQKPFTGNHCQDLDREFCWHEPPSFDNAYTVYNESKATVTCKEGYIAKMTEKELSLNCDHGEWKLPPSTEEPICQPSCVPPCDNDGECTAPNTCTCKPEYYGRVCEKKRCPTVPEAARNSYVVDRYSWRCTHLLLRWVHNEHGNNEVPMKCVEGQWFTIEPKPRKVESLECKPFCAQMCLNGGTCMGPNLCDCNGRYAGRYCQHLRCNDTLVTDDNADVKLRYILLLPPPHQPRSHEGRSDLQRKLPTFVGSRQVEFSCENGHWQAPRTMFVTSRLSWCPCATRVCSNGGKCVAPNTCQCPVGFTGSDCSKRYAHTIDGEPCIFPFLYGGVWYQGCTDADSTRPWCATGVTVHNYVSSWGVCVSDVGNSKVVMTVDGELCNLPFLYKNVRYHTCISTADRPKPWCATHVDGSGAVTKWSVCDPLWGVMTAILTTTGKMCTFPFTHNGNVYTKCVDDNLEQDVYPWCATEVTDDCTPITTETCKLDWGHTKTITTDQKKVCQFPFVWKNQTTHTCLPPAKGMGGPWCATKVDEKRNMMEWDLCILESDGSGVQAPHLEMAGSLGVSGGSYTAWHSINITTITGISCIIPFVYKGKTYNGCIKQGSQPPWCATIVDERKHVMAKGICPNNWDLPRKKPKDDKLLGKLKFEGTAKEHLIHTVSGKVCILPFRYEGIQYHGCISMGSSAPYCATEVDSNGEITSKEECPHDWDEDSLHLNQDAGEHAGLQTVSGESCKFPFYFNGKQYHRCIKVGSHGPFCATEVDGNKQVVATDECDNTNEQNHPGKYVVNYRTPIITASAEVCIFPFVHEGRQYYGCAELSDRSGFICAVHVDEDNVALTFDYCPLNWDATEDAFLELALPDNPLQVTTSTGEKCIFPFTYEGRTYNGCVTLGYERPFCATKIDGEGNLLERGYCTLDWFKPSRPPTSHSTIRDLKTVKGEKCVIPFYFNGREYHGCVTEGTRKPFCATEVNANRVAIVTDLCDDGWQKATPLVQGYLPNVYTEDNKKCVSSYNYNGGRYFGCIRNGSSKPFCATKVDQNEDLVSHGRCSKEWERHKYRVTTETGKECIFPFTYNGVVTSSCIKTAKFSRPFCATEIDEYGSPVETDFCPHDWEMMLVLPGEIKTEFGQPCVFPFQYKHKTYRSCTFDDSLKAWCATTVDANGRKTDWGYCIGLDGSTSDDHSRHGPVSSDRLDKYPASYPGDHPKDDKPRYEHAYPDVLEQPPGYSGDHNGPDDDHDRDCKHTKTTQNQECIFPFEFQGKLHNHCIAMTKNGPPECAVRVDRYGAVVEWGICQP
ncbi:LOW QUALITY PROTEIN: uncharacterized protein [Palaemon carinicauda]|uniref:LOW QUALITY PROTEIN: uncharacterized protein n=1 Tax=Palaemon carinicauda TaxID=392227 RepID=UPI0035B61E66